MYKKLIRIWNKNSSPPKTLFFTKDFPQLEKHEIGEYTYGCPNVFEWGEGATLKIGKFCSIAENVEIFLGGNHRIDWVTTYPFNKIFTQAKKFTGHPTTKGNVIIGSDVWIGSGATILSGVNIGHGAVIGAKAMVTKNIPPYSIVVGNPGRIIKKRFSEEKIEYLLKACWWEWPIEKILSSLDTLLSQDIDHELK